MKKAKIEVLPRLHEFHVYRASGGDWRWQLRAPNGKIVGDSSEGYKNYSDCTALPRLLVKGGFLAVIHKADSRPLPGTMRVKP